MHPMETNTEIVFTLGEIAEKVEGELNGDPELKISGVAPLNSAGETDITFLNNEKYIPQVAQSQAGAILISRDVPVTVGPATLKVDQPYVAFAKVLELYYSDQRDHGGISPQAWVSPEAQVSESCHIYPGAYVGKNAEVGPNSILYPGVFVGDNAKVGSDSILYPNVTVYQGCEIGNRVILHAGCVIGSDGFGYAQKKQADPETPIVHYKIPQVGIVIVEDDVEIGSNTTIDRAALEVTRIGTGSKIDNLVQIGHNCTVGPHTILVSQVGVSGSTRIGKYVTIAGQAGMVGHCEIGDGVTIGAQAGVTKDVPAGATVFGSPAIDARKALRAYSSIEFLPDVRKKVSQLEKKIKELESKLEEA